MPQDFSGQNLRGRSFKGQNLEGANFSYADIRGTDFTKANLMGANFTGVKAGLKLKWIFILLILSLVISSLSGFTSAIIFNFNIYFWFSRKLPAVVVISYSIIFISLVRGLLNNSFAPEAVTINVYISIGVILAVAFFGAPAAAVDEPEAKLGGMAITTFVGMASLIVFIFSQMGGLAQQILINIINIKDQQIILNFAQGQWLGGVVGGIFGGFWGYFFSRSAIDGDPKFSWIWKMCVNFTARGATSFYKADLTDANFTRAIFKSADFKNAILTRTFWQYSKCLELVSFKKSYIQNSQVRKLVVSGNGQEQIFDALNFKGINLSGANLVDASFVGANLSDANLQNTNLSRAKLKQTQLDGTDFTGATLTGAYIEGWGITNKTKFDGVRCEYVYMRLPTKENPDPIRKPDNNQEVFTDGEFGDFIKPIFDTLDLYHNQGVDPRAIAISFKQLAENHPDAELEIVAMEKRGQDKFLLRAKTAVTADKSELSAEYFDTYNEIKALPEREIKLLLEEKDSRIRSLETMVMTALERPSFYSSTQIQEVGSMASNPGGFSVGGSVGGNANNVQGDGNSVVQGDTTMTGDRNINTGGDYHEQSGNFGIGHMSGGEIKEGAKVAGVINEAERQNLAQAAAEIQQLLKQLEQTYPTTTTSQQMIVAAEAINQIETDPTLKKRVINAVKEGGLAAFEKAIDNPAGAFIVGAIKGWQEVEAE